MHELPITRGEPWPSWAKGLLAAMLLLTLAVLIPLLLMLTGCLALGGMDGMRQMVDGGRPMMR